MTPKDMDFIEAKHASAREIALALGVPPMLLGIPGDNTFSNYQEANRTFWRNTVIPLMQRSCRALADWLAPAYGPRALTLKLDLDQVEALSPEREALWSRLEKATFLTDTEKRQAAGYGPLAPKFSPDQPRDDHGRWASDGGGTDGGRWTKPGGGGSGGPSLSLAPDAAPGSDSLSPQADSSQWPSSDSPDILPVTDQSPFSPNKEGWHDYSVGPNEVCSAQQNCSAADMRDYLSRFAFPGQDPRAPVVSNERSFVYDPRNDIPGGWVRTTISDDGLTVANRTQFAHVFYDGQITRTAMQSSDGSWSVSTRGIGNNWGAAMADINSTAGPGLFNHIDRNMRQYIEKNRKQAVMESRLFNPINELLDRGVDCA